MIRVVLPYHLRTLARVEALEIEHDRGRREEQAHLEKFVEVRLQASRIVAQ